MLDFKLIHLFLISYYFWLNLIRLISPFCGSINMIHISPWEATIGLMKTAECSLTQDGVLYCYGPYKEGGTAVESNL